MSATSVTAATEQFSASIREVSEQLGRARSVTSATVETSERTRVAVSNLAEAIGKIGDVANIISEIADQTNLLALNATIEAAPNGNHYHLFVDACLGGAPTTCGFDYAGPLTETVLLGTLANRFPGDELRWQPAAMTIPNHDQADALLRRKYRQGFEVDNLS